MSGFVKHVDALRDRLQTTAMIVHHTGHQEQQRSRGNSALKAALDCEIQCKDGLLTWTKTKDIEPPEPVKFQLIPVEVGADEEGQPIRSCVLEYGEQAPRHQGLKLNAHEKDALVALVAVCAKENTRDASGLYVGKIESWREEFYRLRRTVEPSVSQPALKTAFQRVRGVGKNGGGLLDKGVVKYTADGAVLVRPEDQTEINFVILSTNGTAEQERNTDGTCSGG